MFNMLARLLKLVSKQQNELYIQRVMSEWLKLYQLPKAFILTAKLFLPIKENCVRKLKVPNLYFFPIRRRPNRFITGFLHRSVVVGFVGIDVVRDI